MVKLAEDLSWTETSFDVERTERGLDVEQYEQRLTTIEEDDSIHVYIKQYMPSLFTHMHSVSNR